jgi:hypothetical protein
MNNQSIDDIITEHSNHEEDKLNLNTVNSKGVFNNQNNTFTKNESNINDDSFFGGMYYS